MPLPRPTPKRVLLLVLLASLGTSAVAVGQDRGTGRREADAPRSEDGEDDGAAADTDVVEEAGGKVKVFEFSGLDIAGRLKSPQLLYFLNRLRAEFDHPKLPHRSFTPELLRATKEKAF